MARATLFVGIRETAAQTATRDSKEMTMIRRRLHGLRAGWTCLPIFLPGAPLAAQALLYEIPAAGPVRSVGDLDQDGVPDLVVGLSVHSGADGSELLDTTVPKPNGYDPQAYSIGDVDGDSWPDVVFRAKLTTFQPPFAVYSGLTKQFLGAAEPVFWTPQADTWTWVDGSSDVDGDGVVDLVFGSEVSGFAGEAGFGYLSGADLDPGSTSAAGDTSFQFPGPPGHVADFDGNGVADAQFEQSFGSISIHSYAPLTTPTYLSIVGSALGAADGDGRADLVSNSDPTLTGQAGPLEVRSIAGPSLLLTVPGSFERAAGVGDVDCDGRDDLLAVSTSPAATLLLSGADGDVLWQTPNVALELAPLGDVDQDGIADFALGLADRTQVWSGPGDVQFHCTGKINSAGCTPVVDATGTPTAQGPDDFLITARDVLMGKPGLFFWGTNGGAALPFLGGTLCVQPPLQRGPVLLATGPSDCNAGYAFPFTQSLAVQQGILGGTVVDGQFWMRDPDHPDGTGVALSNGIEFLWCGP